MADEGIKMDIMKKIVVLLIVIVILVGCFDNWFIDMEDDHSKHGDGGSGYDLVHNSWWPANLDDWMGIYVELLGPRGYMSAEWKSYFNGNVPC